ncbi:MAG: hypothetical protein M3177_07175 [Pseudomonadota bacterium]|nr:hypothetical protein [Pseudomonadota bacterium]
MVRRAFPLILLLAAACARSEDAAVVADQNEVQPVERVRAPERDDDDVALGEWRESLQDENMALEFGPAGAPPLFSLRCDTRRSVFLQRHGTLPAGDLPMMLVSIGSETRRLAVTDLGGPVPMLRASLAPSDTLLGTLTGSTSPIAIRIGDSPPLILPPSPAIGAFLSRCSSGAQTQGGGADAAGNNVAEANTAAPAPPPAPPPAR